MAQATSIEWTDVSWNPVHGCSKVSPGCAHCYAETLSRRYGQTRKAWTPANAAENVILKPHKLREPLSNAKAWRGLGAAAAAAGKTDGKLVFVNSTSDLFHDQVPDAFIAQVFNTMELAGHHTYQVLTKRPERMRDLLDSGQWRKSTGISDWPVQNVWLGVSIESRRFVHRADVLRQTLASVRFISAEPLLGPLVSRTRCPGAEGGCLADPEACMCEGQPIIHGSEPWSIDLHGIDWLITGGESGPGHRPVHSEWVEDLRDACQRSDAGTTFFFKQWGGARPKSAGRELDGRTWSEFPTVEAIA